MMNREVITALCHAIDAGHDASEGSEPCAAEEIYFTWPYTQYCNQPENYESAAEIILDRLEEMGYTIIKNT